MQGTGAAIPPASCAPGSGDADRDGRCTPSDARSCVAIRRRRGRNRSILAIGTDGRIAAVAPAINDVTAGESHRSWRTSSWSRGLVDAHQHLDKSRTRRAGRQSDRDARRRLRRYRVLPPAVTRAKTSSQRAERTLDICLATVRLRSEATPISNRRPNLRGIEAMVELRERCRERMTLQVVAHLTTDAPRMLDSSRQWLDGAIAAGADAIGGVPQYSDQPLAFLDLLFELAERSGLPLDMHIDEHLDPRASPVRRHHRAHPRARDAGTRHRRSLLRIERSRIRMSRHGSSRPCRKPASQSSPCPAANLFLQGRDARAVAAARPHARARAARGWSAGRGGVRQHPRPLHPDRIGRPVWKSRAGRCSPVISDWQDHRAAFDMVPRQPGLHHRAWLGLGHPHGRARRPADHRRDDPTTSLPPARPSARCWSPAVWSPAQR